MRKEFKLVQTNGGSKDVESVEAERTRRLNEWQVRCPYHPDMEPSLFINSEKRVFHCQGCGASGKLKDEEVVDWNNPIKEWIYSDEQGNPVSKKSKFPKSIDGGETYTKKTYIQYKWANGKWTKGLTLKNSVLYNLPVLAKAEKGSKVFLVEGEKDADNLNKHYFATTTSFGAGKWSKHYNKYFKGMHVYIIPDEDQPGYQHAIKVGLELRPVAESVKLIFLGKKDSPKGYDFSDWLEDGDGNKKEEFEELIDNAPDFDVSLLRKYEDEEEVSFDADCNDKTETKQFNLTEAGNAERFALQCGDKIRYNWTSGTWLYFDGKRWNPHTGCASSNRLALETARNMFEDAKQVDDTEKRSKIIKWSLYSEKLNVLNNTLSIARSMQPIEAYSKQFDQNQYLLNVENGTIDLKSGKLLPHNPKHMITKLAPVVYDEEATFSLWLDCLNTWMQGDQDSIDYLQRLGGMCLTGDISSRVFPIFYGSGKNGKSVFCDTIRNLMGDYATVAPKNFLAKKKYDGHPTEIAGLLNMRLVIVSETPKNMILRLDLVKSMTGDAVLKARFMRRDFFEFQITHKVLVMTQNLPIIDETTDAIWDRVHRVGWKFRIPVEKQNTHLLSDLEKEKSGILNWLIEGCLKWQKDEYLNPTEAIVQETLAYRQSSQPLGDFIEDNCRIDPEKKVKKTQLYAAYKEWTEDKFPMKERAFNREMSEMSFKAKDAKIEGKTAKCWIGICLKDSDADSETEENNNEDNWNDVWAEQTSEEVQTEPLSSEARPKYSPANFDYS